jgi:hypothetical protein
VNVAGDMLQTVRGAFSRHILEEFFDQNHLLSKIDWVHDFRIDLAAAQAFVDLGM